MSDVNTLVIDPLRDFAKDSIRLIKKCTKPDRKVSSINGRHPARTRLSSSSDMSHVAPLTTAAGATTRQTTPHSS